MVTLVSGQNELNAALSPILSLFGLKGDVNGDGKVDDSDVRAMVMLLEGTINLQALVDSSNVFKNVTGYIINREATLRRCDMNDDGVINYEDLALLEVTVGYHWRDPLTVIPVYR